MGTSHVLILAQRGVLKSRKGHIESCHISIDLIDLKELHHWIHHSLNHQIRLLVNLPAAPRGPSSGFPMMRRCAATEAASRNVPTNLFILRRTVYSAVRFGETVLQLGTLKV